MAARASVAQGPESIAACIPLSGVPTAPLFGCVDAEVLGACFQLRGQCAGDTSPAWMQRDQRIALAALVIPHLRMCQFGCWHTVMTSGGT